MGDLQEAVAGGSTGVAGASCAVLGWMLPVVPFMLQTAGLQSTAQRGAAAGAASLRASTVSSLT